MVAPIASFFCIGLLGFFPYIRPSAARLPILIPAALCTGAVYALYYILLSLHIVNSDVLAIMYLSLILSGYTFFFAQAADLRMVRRVLAHVLSTGDIAFGEF